MSKPLPQLVPGAACLRCDVCCRFPDADSFLRPYFTRDEIARAVAAGMDPHAFPRSTGAQINLVKEAGGEGYLCPAFDPATNRCGIYEARPLDCQLYPLALMWDAAREEVLLGWDTKCPFMRDTVPAEIAAHAERVSALLEAEDVLDTLAAHPRLVGRFQDDVIALKSLPSVTARLTPRSTDARLNRLTAADAPRFHDALIRASLLGPEALAAYAFPYHYAWTSVLPYWWMETAHTFFLFAQSADGWFMPLPPLGTEPLERTAAEAFVLMDGWNGPSPVSRIENVMASQKNQLEPSRFRFVEKEGDYLYPATALSALAGDRYKSQRALCNRVTREHAVQIEAYGERDVDACRALYSRWATQKLLGSLDEAGRFLLEDAAAAHQRVLTESRHLNLQGTVARVDGTLAAYTFGYWLTPQTFCVLLEVADRALPGLAQCVFRETCRSAAAHGAVYINVMDDAGLPGLRDAKRAYHPAMTVRNWIMMGS
jgi:uncharacterized protein